SIGHAYVSRRLWAPCLRASGYVDGANGGIRTRDPHLGIRFSLPLHSGATAPVQVTTSRSPLETGGTAQIRSVGVADGTATLIGEDQLDVANMLVPAALLVARRCG